jgi:hypothetical protein
MKYKKAPKKCYHEIRGMSVIKDFTFEPSWSDSDKGAHLYCPICKGHWYKGRFWNYDDWYDYVNEV